MKKIVAAMFVLLFALSVSAPCAITAQNKIDLTEHQKKEQERLKKLKEQNKKGKSYNNSSLDAVKGTVKFRERNPILSNDKTYITDKGSITISDNSDWSIGGNAKRIRDLGNKLQLSIVESGLISYVTTLFLFIALFYLAVMWKLFNKAGYSGLLSIIPLVNAYILVKIAGRSFLFFLLMFIPGLGFILAIVMHIDIAKNFGKSTAFGLGLTFFGFIFYPLLAFGTAEYEDSTIPQY